MQEIRTRATKEGVAGEDGEGHLGRDKRGSVKSSYQSTNNTCIGVCKLKKERKKEKEGERERRARREGERLAREKKEEEGRGGNMMEVSTCIASSSNSLGNRNSIWSVLVQMSK